MDAVSYIKELRRLCYYYSEIDCCDHTCPMFTFCNSGNDVSDEEAEKMVPTVEKWSKEHPMVTNGQKVREMFPQIEGVSRTKDYVSTAFSRDWWDAEYKGE